MPTKADVKAVVEGLSHLLARRLSSGTSVHLEGIGYFSVGITAPTFSDPSEINARQIKVRTVDFRPEKKLIEEIAQKTSFQKSTACERSVTLTDKAVRRLLRDYLEIHDCISAMPSGSEWIYILLIVLLVFGGKKIPELARGLGKGVKSFKEGINEAKEEISKAKDEVEKSVDDSTKKEETEEKK